MSNSLVEDCLCNRHVSVVDFFKISVRLQIAKNVSLSLQHEIYSLTLAYLYSY
jgi:hypothetical protein